MVDAAGAEVHDFLRQGFPLTGLISAAASMLWAIWLFLFAAKGLALTVCAVLQEGAGGTQPFVRGLLAGTPRCRVSCSNSSEALYVAGPLGQRYCRIASLVALSFEFADARARTPALVSPSAGRTFPPSCWRCSWHATRSSVVGVELLVPCYL